MPSQANRDLAAAALFAVGAVLVLWKMQGLGESAIVESGGITPATLPTIYAAILLGLSTILGITSLFARRRQREAGARVDISPTIVLRIVGTLILLVAFAVLLPLAPFMPVAAVFLLSLFVLYGHRRPVAVTLVALTGAALLDVLFVRILQLPL